MSHSRGPWQSKVGCCGKRILIRATKLQQKELADFGTGIPGRHPGGIAEDTLPGRFYMVGYPERGLDSRIIRQLNHVTIKPLFNQSENFILTN